jgi:undecaprenyl-diphosphatase
VTKAQAAPAAPRPTLRQRYPWLLPGGLLLLLTFLTVNVLADGPLIPADRRIHRFVHATANSAGWRWLKHGPASPARLLVDLGNIWVAVPVLLVIAALVATRRRTVAPLLTAATGVVLLVGTVFPAKFLIKWLDPGYRQLNPHGLLSEFPSGHAATAGVCYFLAVLVAAPYPGGRRRRIALRAVAVLGFLVGAAMVWCDMHRFTDVVAGWALAALIIPLTLRLTRRWQRLPRGEGAGGARAAPGPPGGSPAAAASASPR